MTPEQEQMALEQNAREEAIRVFLSPQSVLDYGMVRLVDFMGDDNDIPEAARISYQKGTRKVNEDRGLIRYLMRHRHSSPSEMVEVKLHINAPMFVARQVMRHRTFSINEVSARYSILEEKFYLPSLEQMCLQSTDNKQGRAGQIPEAEAIALREAMHQQYRDAYAEYTKLIESGLARELARSVLPVAVYTEWYQKGNLWNWMHFLELRLDPHAQYEVRAYAEVICDILKVLFPDAMEAFEEYLLYGQRLSRTEWTVIKSLVNSSAHPLDDLQRAISEAGLTGREKREFLAKLSD